MFGPVPGLINTGIVLAGRMAWAEQMGNGVQEGESTLFYWAPVHSHSTICFHVCGLIQSSQQFCGVGIIISDL